jgi:hypothetical protein
VAPVAERLVLDPAAALVELRVRQLHDVERVRDLARVREGVGEGLPVRPGQVEHAPGDAGSPRPGLGLDPRRRPGSCAPRDDVEQLRRASDVHDGGAPVLAAPPAGAGEERLIEAQRAHWADASRVVDQRRAVGGHGVHDGVPVTAELTGDLRHRAALAADLDGDPPPGPVGHRRACRGDLGVGLGPRPDTAPSLGAAPAALAPHQHRWTAERRQVDQRDGRAVLHPRSSPASGAADHLGSGLNVHPQRPAGLVLDTEDGHVGQADEQGAHARSVGLHRGSGASVGVGTTDSSGTCATPGGPLTYAATPRSNPKRWFPSFDRAQELVLQLRRRDERVAPGRERRCGTPGRRLTRVNGSAARNGHHPALCRGRRCVRP